MDATQVKLIVVSAGVFEVDFVSTIKDYNSAQVEYGATTAYGTTLNARGDGNGNYVGGFESTLTAFHYRCTVTDGSTPPVVDSSGDLAYGVAAPPTGGHGHDDDDDDHGKGDHDGDHGRGDHGDKGKGHDKDDHGRGGRGDR